MAELRFDNQVAIVTGAGNGLGKAFAKLLAARGARVVVNDIGTSIEGEGSSTAPADATVKEILDAGGEAVAEYTSVAAPGGGAAIVRRALDAFGASVDIVVCAAGILRDVTFRKMTDKDWISMYDVHLKGVYSVLRAAWPHMEAQKYGRVVNLSSQAGLYGNFGQANLSAMKRGVVGLTQALAIEGERNGIKVNVIAPLANSRMTQTVHSEKTLKGLPTESVAKVAGYLCHEACAPNGGVFEIGGSFIAQVRWERSVGVTFPKGFAVEDVASQFGEISNFTKGTEHPESIKESMGLLVSKL